MNWPVILLALFIAYLIFVELKLYFQITRKALKVHGEVLDIQIKESFTRWLNQVLQGGKHKRITISYKFRIDNKEYKMLNDELLVSPGSKFAKLKKGDKITVYVLMDAGEVFKTKIFKPRLTKLIPYVLIMIILILVAYATTK